MGFNEDSLFCSGFSIHWFEEAVVKAGDEFSIIYIFITLFVIMCISELNNVSNFVFHCKKKRNSASRNLIFKVFFPILRNKTKLMINS